jgi:glycerol kinase
MSSQGVAFLAGLSVGIWKKKDLLHLHKIGKVFKPTTNNQDIATLQTRFNRWKQAVDRSLKWEY